MPWARIPPDKLVLLPMFGINLIKDDGNYLWYTTPDGRKMRVSKRTPRVLFEEIADAHQCGATAIMLNESQDPPEGYEPAD